MDDVSCFIDGFGPIPVSQPGSVAELAGQVRAAAAENKAIYPVAGRTMLGMGASPTKSGLAIDVRTLDQVVDYPAPDMTITVQAGITMARLQAILAPHNQRLPIDVPGAERATLGGILSTNASGPRRFGHGTLRDYVLGISAVNDEGHQIKAGGRVVKNVAGYDLCKLFIGALGTLGIITQVTLKLRPLAEESALIVLGVDKEQLQPVLDILQQTRTRPVCLDILNPPAAKKIFSDAGLPALEASWTLLVGFESNAEDLEWQVQQLVREVKGTCLLDARLGWTAATLWQALADFPLALASASGSHLTFKANMLSSGTAAFCAAANGLPEPPMFQAHAGNGIVVGHLDGLTKERAAELLHTLRALAIPFQGSVIVLDCPPAWKSLLDVWGRSRADVALMREIKNKLDPRNLFNPGRFVGGI
jgi:glycolate oxidase FAD binding subunit